MLLSGKLCFCVSLLSWSCCHFVVIVVFVVVVFVFVVVVVVVVVVFVAVVVVDVVVVVVVLACLYVNLNFIKRNPKKGVRYVSGIQKTDQ